jgi:hypothetical protein
VEWLRWLGEFQEHLAGVLRPAAAAFHADLQQVADAYEREAQRLQRQLCRSERFSHRLLTGERCDEVFRDARPAIEANLSDGAWIPFSRYLPEDDPHLLPGEHPLNHQFQGLDAALTDAAAAVLGEWLQRGAEELLLDDAAVAARSLPRHRLRALVDAARPLVRPEDLALQPAHTSVLLLGRDPQESGLPAVFSELEPLAHHAGEGDVARIALRTALHGFPAFALRQLEPVRDAYTAAPSPSGLSLDPLPASSLMQRDHEELLALAVVFNRIQPEGSGLRTPWFPEPIDDVALSRFFSCTFGGQSAYTELRAQVGSDYAELVRGQPEGAAAETIRARAATLPHPHATRLERIASAMDRGNWPVSVAFAEVEGA